MADFARAASGLSGYTAIKVSHATRAVSYLPALARVCPSSNSSVASMAPLASIARGFFA
jgi:hypothetical protein